jgi:hypothetical protein
MDDLYDALDVNKGLPTKYFLSYRKEKSVREGSPQFKLLRKFFYENSSFLGGEAVFMEITNSELAIKLGFANSSQIVCL